MNEEEKKSVNELKEEINKPVEVQGDKFNTFILYNIESAQIILNLIEKLQKENEELNKENEHNKLLLNLNNNFTIDKKTGNYKWNVIEIQKVKDKIEELKQEKGKYGNCLIEMYEDELVNRDIKILQELIEEREEKE